MQCPSTSLSESNPLSNLGFDELLALADAAWAHSNASLPGNDDGLKDQYPYILTFKSHCMDDTLTNPTNNLLSHHHLSIEQHSIIHDNPQCTSCTSCCSMTTSQVAPPIPDNGIRAERRQAAAMQINMEEKDQGPKTNNVSAKNIDNNGTLHSKEGQPEKIQKLVSPKPVQSNNDQTGKRMCVTRKILNKNSTAPTVVTVESTKEMMPESAKTCSRSLDFDKGARDVSSADKETATVDLGKEIGVVAREMSAGLVCELSSSVKQASNYMSFPNDRLGKSPSKSNPPGERPKEIPAAKRKHVRREGSNKIYAPPTEVTGKEAMMPESNKMSWRRTLNFDIGTTDESSGGRENLNMHICKENGLVVGQTHVGLAYNQAPSSSTSKCNPPRPKPKESPTSKRKYERKKRLNKTSTPAEMTGELTESMIPESTKISCRRCLNFDKGARVESNACRESLARDKDSLVKQALYNHMSLPEDTQTPSTFLSKGNHPWTKLKENPTGKRKYVRKKRLKISTPTEMTGELTEPRMPESTKISCRRSLNFDKGARGESNAFRENLNVHISKENRVVVEETHASPAHDQNALGKQTLYNHRLLPSTLLSKSNPLGAKLNANSVENKDGRKGPATVQDGNISNSQMSTIRLQMVGYKRENSGNIKHADNSSMNLVGTNYNGLPSYQSKFWIQFPNIQKKRRAEKGKTSNTHITSSVTTRKEVRLTCPQEDAKAHPYASSSSCHIYGSGNNAAKVPTISESTESVFDNTQTFTELLRRVTERSRPPTQICDYASLTRIRNCDKQLGISQRPQTCIDDLVAETRASLTKKNRNRRKSALSSSAYSSTNERQRHHNFALGNYHLPLGKSVGVSREVIRKTVRTVDALAEKFRQLNINIEARDLAFHKQDALVPCKQPYPWRWHHHSLSGHI